MVEAAVVDDWMKEKHRSKAEYIFGCRHPDSEPFSWDRALVFGKYEGSSGITAAMFQNGMDFIGHPRDYREAYLEYNHCVKEGWIPMSKEDLEKTSGVEIDSSTSTCPHPYTYTMYDIVEDIVMRYPRMCDILCVMVGFICPLVLFGLSYLY
jgi:hypothetical protein